MEKPTAITRLMLLSGAIFLFARMPLYIYAGSQEDSALEHWADGVSLYHKGEYEKALNEFQQAVKNHPEKPHYHIWLGATAYQAGNVAFAVKELAKYAETVPQLGGYYWLGKSYLKLEKLDKSRKAFDSGLSSESDSGRKQEMQELIQKIDQAKYYYGLCEKYKKEGKQSSALKALKKAFGIIHMAVYDSEAVQLKKIVWEKRKKVIVSIILIFCLAGFAILIYMFVKAIWKRRTDTLRHTISHPTSIKDVFGSKYERLAEIGRGGMGIVYEARDKMLNRKVAIKRMKDELYINRRAVEKFLNEAKTVAQLTHPNIVVVHEIIEEQDMVYIVFEYIDGYSLEKRLNEERRRLTLTESVALARQVCNALSYAHDHGVIHRDLKPSNVMVTKEGMAKVMDFGIARIVKDSIWSSSGQTTGTLAYMSPEQHAGLECDPSSDIYSLGITFYEMITGELPFKGPDFAYQKERIYYHPIREIFPDIPEKLEKMIAKCLEIDRKKRYGSGREFAADLQSL